MSNILIPALQISRSELNDLRLGLNQLSKIAKAGLDRGIKIQLNQNSASKNLTALAKGQNPNKSTHLLKTLIQLAKPISKLYRWAFNLSRPDIDERQQSQDLHKLFRSVTNCQEQADIELIDRYIETNPVRENVDLSDGKYIKNLEAINPNIKRMISRLRTKMMDIANFFGGPVTLKKICTEMEFTRNNKDKLEGNYRIKLPEGGIILFSKTDFKVLQKMVKHAIKARGKENASLKLKFLTSP